MKKRMAAFLVVMVMMVACCANAMAHEPDISPYASAVVTGGLNTLGNGQYEIWGRIQGAREELSIRIELKTTSGSYIDGASNTGIGPTVSISEKVALNPGTYYLYLYGETSSHTPSQVLVVRAS